MSHEDIANEIYLKHSLEESPPRHLEDFVSLPSEKCLSSLPHNGKSKSLEAYNPLAEEGSVSEVGTSQSWTYPLTTIGQLSAVLGPDNTPHSVEIDTIPCAVVRIPQGSLTGLLAWRLFAKDLQRKASEHGGRQSHPCLPRKPDGRAMLCPARRLLNVHSFSAHDENPAPRLTPARMSTISLALIQLKAPSEPSSTPDFTSPAVLSALPHSDDLLVKGHSADGRRLGRCRGLTSVIGLFRRTGWREIRRSRLRRLRESGSGISLETYAHRGRPLHAWQVHFLISQTAYADLFRFTYTRWDDPSLKLGTLPLTVSPSQQMPEG
ncbi:LOW QUALITY PROTEIN: hypothetical protein CVT26_008833 [Gymnopilus dilepis]|uniref:Uncharacterized protein n=1 Tax=Gymnopilus dilepis TaxID=231916 RepID=A0A409X4H0_9AGAR|nr:LOW QUALITY PROTEIN: hypothetical protein CVT26_008833 [Gymnopilus dilepis]